MPAAVVGNGHEKAQCRRGARREVLTKMVSKGLRATGAASSTVRIGALYGALFLAIGMMMPLLPVWLAARGLTDAVIGQVQAGQSLARVVAQPLVAHVADASGRMRLVMLASALASVAALAWLGVGSGEVAIFTGVVMAAFFFSPLVPLTESVAVREGARLGVAYGRLRLWGSLTFVLGAVLAGISLDALPAAMLVWALVAAQGLVVASIALQPEWLMDGPARAAAAVAGRGSRRTLLSGAFLLFLLVAGLIQASHALLYGFASLHWQRLGHSGVVIGALVATGVLAEVALFWFSGPVMERIGAVRLMMLAAAAGVARWAGMAFDPPLAGLFALQALHGLTFGAAHLGAVAYVRTRAPARLAATGQAMYSAVSMGLFMTVAMWASGRLYAAHGARAWLAMAAMTLAALVLGFALRRVSPPPARPTGRRKAAA